MRTAVPSVDLRPDHWDIVRRVLRWHVPDREVLAFGSRATWTAKDYSDLDLAVMGEEPLSLRTASALDEALGDSDLPFKVDVVDWARIDDGFRSIIRRYGVSVQTPPATSDTARAAPPSSLADIIDLTLSSVDKKTKPGERPVRLCNYMDVYNNTFITDQLDFMAATATDREVARCGLARGDVIITKDSEKHDDIGVPALVRHDIVNLVCGYHLAILRPRPAQVVGDYLIYALSAPQVQHQFHAYANGVTRFGLRKGDIGLVEVPLPPLPEQRAIAHVLGTLDDKIELNRRMNETLEKMARALFKSWFVDFDPVRAKLEGRDTGLPQDIADLFPDRLVDSKIGEIPDGWEVARLRELMEVNPKRRLRRGQIAPYLPMKKMPTQGHVPDTVSVRPFGSGMRFANGDTLIARITPCLENGKAAYVDFLRDDEVGWGSTEYIVLKPRPPLPDQFSYCLARSAALREFAIQNMSGTSGRQRVPATAMKGFLMVAPPVRLARQFGEVAGLLFERASGAGRESRTLAALRDTLLPSIISGELRLEDAARIIGTTV